MSATTHTDIFCDGCGNWEHGGGYASVKKARAFVIKNYGWKHIKQDGRMVDLCPKCTRAQPKSESIPLDVFDKMERVSIDEVRNNPEKYTSDVRRG